jgi:hypothetical protein
MVRPLRLYTSPTAKAMRAHSAETRIESEYIPPPSGIQEGLREEMCIAASSGHPPWSAPTTVVTYPEIRRNT